MDGRARTEAGKSDCTRRGALQCRRGVETSGSNSRTVFATILKTHSVSLPPEAKACTRYKPMRTAVKCVICSGQRVYYAFSVQKYRLVTCRDCGHMMLNPPPTERDLAGFGAAQHGGDNESRLHVSEMKQATARHYLDLIGRYRGGHGGALLEIGCGSGDVLAAAADLGYEVTGMKYSA